MDLAHGGHLSHGSPASFSGKFYRGVFYGVDRKTETIDFDEVQTLARQHRPKVIVVGASAYPRTIDYERFRRIADEVGALVLADIAHIGGLVAAGIHPSPVPCCEFVTMTTHKTLRGPRGGLILCRQKYAQALDAKIFPGMQGGPLMHIIAAKAVAFREALTEDFRAYQRQIVSNAKTLAETLMKAGFRLVSGGTDNHLMLVDLTDLGITGQAAQETLDRTGITINKNRIPFDTRGPQVTSGIRIGTPALTTRGMKEPEMELIAGFFTAVLRDMGNERLHSEIRQEVRSLCERFPLYPERIRENR
jgi:glycine hydroxymethyltransferase